MSTNVATQNKSNTAGMSKVRFITQVGMLGAIAVILMAFEIPLPFAPAFYKIDFSEVPALIGCFAMGPAAGAMIELIKIVLHLLISGTSTAGVGDIANFAIGCAFISSLYIEDLEPEALKDFFPEFEAYEDECRFLGCVHIGERECGVKTAVQEHKIGQSRYDNYRLMYQELKEKKKYGRSSR